MIRKTYASNRNKTFLIINSRPNTLNGCFSVQSVIVRTCSRQVNGSGNQKPGPRHVIERATEFMPAAEPIMVAGVQAMICELLAEKMEETKQILQGNKKGHCTI